MIMNRRGMNKFIEIEKMLDKEKEEEIDLELMDYRDDMRYL